MSQTAMVYELAKELAEEMGVELDDSLIRNRQFKQTIADKLLAKFKAGEISTKKSGSDEELSKYFLSVASNTLTKDKRINPSGTRLRLRKIK